MKRFLISSAILISVVGLPAQNALGDTNEIATPSINAGIQASVSAGGFHTCAITGSGAAKCWGRNTDGQLGNSRNNNSSYPVQVSGLTENVMSISAGYDHACAVTLAGAAKCWGNNDDGELGNGNNTSSNRPVTVRGLNRGVAAISAGSNFTCAKLVSGSIKCWGKGTYTQLGNGSTGSTNVPVRVIGLGESAKSVSAGGLHACALLESGAVKCWGYNTSGQLGNGSLNSTLVPVSVIAVDEVVAITTGAVHSCAILAAGEVKCWGSNSYGQLGTSRMEYSATPVRVANVGANITTISAGGSSNCVLNSDGIAKCWGDNTFGELGNGTVEDVPHPRPARVLTLAGAKAVTVGWSHACAVTSGRKMRCWGYNVDGQMGNPDLTNMNPLPEPVLAGRAGRHIGNIGNILPI